MGKHKKMTAAPVAADGIDDLDLAEAALREALALARGQLGSGGESPQLLREIGGLADKLVGLAAERRARAKLQVHTVRNLPRELVVAYLRELGEDERTALIQELRKMNAGGSVLG